MHKCLNQLSLQINIYVFNPKYTYRILNGTFQSTTYLIGPVIAIDPIVSD